MRKTELFKADARDLYEIINVPMIVIEHKSGKKISYAGFVPGLTKKDVLSVDYDECKFEIQKKTLELLKKVDKFLGTNTTKEIMKDEKQPENKPVENTEN